MSNWCKVDCIKGFNDRLLFLNVNNLFPDNNKKQTPLETIGCTIAVGAISAIPNNLRTIEFGYQFQQKKEAIGFQNFDRNTIKTIFEPRSISARVLLFLVSSKIYQYFDNH